MFLFTITIERTDVENRLSGLSYTNEGNKITAKFRFTPMSLNASGPEVLAIKKLLSGVTYDALDLLTVRGEPYSLDPSDVAIDSSDGPHFDSKMQLAIAAYQTKYKRELINILREYEKHTDPEAAFRAEYRTLSAATLLHMHGYNRGIVQETYQQTIARIGTETELYAACGNIVDQAIAISQAQQDDLDSAYSELLGDSPPPDNNAGSTTSTAGSGEDLTLEAIANIGGTPPRDPNDLLALVNELDPRPEPGLNPKPIDNGSGWVEMTLRTRYAFDNNPPNLTNDVEKNAFFETDYYKSLESEAIQRVFAFFNKKPRFTLSNDISGPAGTISTGPRSGRQAANFPLVSGFEPGREVGFHIIDTDSPQYLPSAERLYNQTSHSDLSNIISFEGIDPPRTPESNYVIIFNINKSKMMAIETPPSEGRSYDALELYAAAKESYEQVREISDKLNLTGEGPFMKGYSRQAKREVKKYKKRWNAAKQEFQRKSTKDQLSTLHDLADKKLGINIGDELRKQTLRNRLDVYKKQEASGNAAKEAPLPDPISVHRYKLDGLQNRVVKVADAMRKYHEDFVSLTAGGKDLAFDPPVNLQSEADRLVAVHSAIRGYINTRGHNPDKPDHYLEVSFKKTNDGKGVQISKMDIVKLAIERDSTNARFIEADPVPEAFGASIVKARIPLADTENNNPNYSPFRKAPFNDRIALGYFYSLNYSYREVTGNRGLFIGDGQNIEGTGLEFLQKCREVTTLGALMFVSKYRIPSPVVSSSRSIFRRPEATEFDIDTNIRGTLKSAKQKIEQGVKANAEKATSGNLFSVRTGKPFRIEDELGFGELCDLEDLYGEFINKFNMQAIICDMLACFPDIPPIPLDFDLKIPDLPDLPTFDPMQFVRPAIEAALMFLLKSFLCALINAILNIIRDPTCEDLYDLALRGAVSLIDLIKEASSERNLDQKLTIIDTLRNSGIPPEAFASENGLGDTPNTVSSLFNEISDLLTIDQLCSLLQGEPSQNTLDIIEITIAENHSELAKYFYGTEDVKTIFSQLGSLIDPEICKRIIDAAEKTEAEKLCPPDNAERLKKALEERGTAKDEIQKAISAVKGKAMRRSQALQALLSGNPINQILQNAEIPASPAVEMPSFLKDMINNRVGGIVDSLRSSLRIDSQNFIEGLYDQLTVPIEQGDSRFDSTSAYKFYRGMAILGKINERNYFSRDTSGRLQIPAIWELREYLYADNTIFTQVPDATDKSMYLEYPFPTPDDLDPTKYQITSVVVERQENGDEVRAPAFLIKPSFDIANLNRSRDRPFARPIVTGIVVGKSSKKPHRIEAGIYYNDADQGQSGNDAYRLRDVAIPNFALPESGILGGGGPFADIGNLEDDRAQFISLDQLKGNISKEIMADVNEKMNELQQDLINYTETNMATNLSAELLPAIRSVFSVEAELLRELEQSRIELADDEQVNRFREVVEFTRVGPQEDTLVTFSVPDIGLGPIDKVVSYREKAASDITKPDTYTITIDEQNFTGEELVITGTDCAYPFVENSETEATSPPETLIGGRDKRKIAFAEMADNALRRAITASTEGAHRSNLFLLNVSRDEEENKNIFQHYQDVRASFYEVLFEQVLSQYKKSKIFNEDYVRELAARLLRYEYVDNGNCLIESKDVFGLEQLAKIISNKIQDEFHSADFDPFQYDFKEPGPVEKGMVQGLSEFLIRIYVVEFALRSSITMSGFSTPETLKEDGYIVMLSEYIKSNMEFLIGDSVAKIVMTAIRKATGKSNDIDAIREIVAQQVDQMKEKIDFIFGNAQVYVNLQNEFISNLPANFVQNTLQIEDPETGISKGFLNPSTQDTSYEFKQMLASGKPFFHLEKYFKYDSPRGDNILEKFQQKINLSIQDEIIDAAKAETIVERDPGPRQITREQFENFEGQQQADSIVSIVTGGDDVQMVLRDIKKKVDDADPGVEFFSPDEIQTYFDNLAVDTSDEADQIRELADLEDEMSFADIVPVKYIRRKRVHLKVNEMRYMPNDFTSDFLIHKILDSSQRNEVIDNWISYTKTKDATERDQHIFEEIHRESDRFYGIQMKLPDIFAELDTSQFSSFFGKEAVRQSNQREFIDKIRAFYSMTNGVENHTFVQGDERSSSTLKPSGIRWTDDEGNTTSYDINVLDPNLNPTVFKVENESDFLNIVSDISDANRALNIRSRSYEVWTEYVIHFPKYPFFQYGENFDSDDVLPNFNVTNFFTDCGITAQTGQEGVAGMKEVGVNRNGVFVELTDHILGRVKDVRDTYNRRLRTIKSRADDIISALRAYDAVGLRTNYGENLGGHDETREWWAVRDRYNEISNDGEWDIDEEFFSAAAAKGESLRRVSREEEINLEVVQIVYDKYATLTPGINPYIGRSNSIRDLVSRDYGLSRGNPVPLNRLRQEFTRDLFLLGQQSVKMNPRFAALMRDNLEFKPNTRNFFTARQLDFEASPSTKLNVANTLTRSDEIGLDNIQSNILFSPVTVLCRRVDHVIGTEIYDSQVYMGFDIPKVLKPITGENNTYTPTADYKKTRLTDAMGELCRKFKNRMTDEGIPDIEAMFKSYYWDYNNGSTPENNERRFFTPPAFSTNALYQEAAKISMNKNYAGFGWRTPSFEMTHPYRTTAWDDLFIVSDLALVKSPIRKGSGTLAYYDTNISIEKLNEIIHPHFDGLYGAPRRGAPFSAQPKTYRTLNTTPKSIYEPGGQKRPYSTHSRGLDKRRVAANFFRFIANYLKDFVDRRTLSGIYGKMAPPEWKQYLLNNSDLGSRQSVTDQQRNLTDLVRSRDARSAAQNIRRDGVGGGKFHLYNRYGTISMIYSDGASGFQRNMSTINHSFNRLRENATDFIGKKRALDSSNPNWGRSDKSAPYVRYKVKDSAGSEFLNRWRNILYDGNKSLGYGINFAREFRARMQIRNSYKVRQIFTINALDRVRGFYGVDLRNMIISAFYDSIITDLKLGVRLLGTLSRGDSRTAFRILGTGPLIGAQFGQDEDYSTTSFTAVASESKSFIMSYKDSNGTFQDRFTIPFAYYEEKFDEECIDITDFVETYEEAFSYLKENLTETRDYKQLMNFVFPMQRLFGICGVYAMFVLSAKPELVGLFNTAKAEILSNIAMSYLASSIDYASDEGTVVANTVKACTPALMEAMENGHGSDGFKLPISISSLGGFFEMFAKQLEKQAKEFLVKVPRTLAQATDPAYRDMKKKVDSCQLDGITFKQFEYTTGTRDLNKGVTEDRRYASVNVAFPIDFMSSFVPFPPYIINFKQMRSSLLKLTNSILNSGMLPPEAQLVRDLSGNCGPLGPSSNAYGSFMIGPALLAMGVNQLSGDIGKYKTECPPGDMAVADTGMLPEPSPCDDNAPATPDAPESSSATSDPCAPQDNASSSNDTEANNNCDPPDGSGTFDGL